MRMPAIGFGCSPVRAGGQFVDLEAAVREALATGYRLFDVAELYGNESAVGRSLRSPVAPPRDELFIVGKLWRTSYRPESVRAACEASLRRLAIDRFDLYLMHAPGAWQHVAPLDDAEKIGWEELRRRALPRDAAGAPAEDGVSTADTWAAMRALVDAGLAAAVGVSNFAPGQIEELPLAPPSANQIACSPREPNRGIVDWCRERGIAVMAHSPLSSSRGGVPEVERIGAAIGRTPEQVILRWLIQSGVTPLPSSADPAHIRENFAALDFALDREQMRAIGG